MRCAPLRSVSMGTKANTMELMSTALSASSGPTATASESARLCVPSRYAVRATRAKPMMLPVTMPAPMVRPPRTSGLSTARVITRSAAKTGSGDCVLMKARAGCRYAPCAIACLAAASAAS